MKHSRPDYQNRIVDLSGAIPDNEPVFLLRAKDVCSPFALHVYLSKLVQVGAGRDIIAATNAALNSFSKWQMENRPKVPDIGTVKELPVSDHPLLTKALNDLSAEKEKTSNLAGSLDVVNNQLSEYSERYSELKKLHSSTVEELDNALSRVAELEKLLNGKMAELTQTRFDFKTLQAANDKLSSDNKALENTISNDIKVITDLQTELLNTKTALKKEIDNNAV